MSEANKPPREILVTRPGIVVTEVGAQSITTHGGEVNKYIIHSEYEALQSRLISADVSAEFRIDQIAALQQQVEALTKDAERYRWLRHGDNDESVIRELDEAIDTAIEASKQ